MKNISPNPPLNQSKPTVDCYLKKKYNNHNTNNSSFFFLLNKNKKKKQDTKNIKCITIKYTLINKANKTKKII